MSRTPPCDRCMWGRAPRCRRQTASAFASPQTWRIVTFMLQVAKEQLNMLKLEKKTLTLCRSYQLSHFSVWGCCSEPGQRSFNHSPTSLSSSQKLWKFDYLTSNMTKGEKFPPPRANPASLGYENLEKTGSDFRKSQGSQMCGLLFPTINNWVYMFKFLTYYESVGCLYYEAKLLFFGTCLLPLPMRLAPGDEIGEITAWKFRRHFHRILDINVSHFDLSVIFFVFRRK